MNKTREQLVGEIRYAIRLTQRTARLYRRVQTAGTFLSIVGGSAALSSIASASVTGGVPAWIGLVGGALLTMAGAALIAIRPADKAAANEADTKRYVALMSKSHGLTEEALALAIDEAHQGDAQEIEPLRIIAFNDVAIEFNRADVVQPLSWEQRILSALA